MATPAVRNNNPGNLKDPTTGTFRQFKTPQEGYAALLNDLQAKQTGTSTTGLGPSSTLVDFAATYAPKGDNNNPGQYAANLANKIGARPDSKLQELDLAKWAAAVADNEDKDSPFAGQKVISSGYNPKPFSNPSVGQFDFSGTAPTTPPPEQKEGLDADLSKRVTDIGGAFKVGGQGITDIASGNVIGGTGHLASGVIQTAGALAGGIGDVLGAGLKLIPGVKQAEEVVGKGVGALAQTETGQKVVGGVSKWAEENPELAKDIGAVGNIASIFPMFKAAGLAVTAGRTALDKAAISSLTKAAGSEIEGALGTSQAAKNLVKKGAINTALEKEYLPDVVQDNTGKYVYSTAKADTKADLEETALEDKLQGMITSKSDTPISLKQARDSAVKEAREAMGRDPELSNVESNIDNIFDYWENRFGKKQTLKELTQNKRDVRQSVKFDTPAHIKDASYYVGQGLMKSIEDTAASRGIQGVREVNTEMGKIINARKMLSKLEGKSPKTSKTGKWHKEVAADVLGGVGEAIGRVTGLPYASTLAGRGLAGLVRETPSKALQGLTRAKGPMPSPKQILKKGTMGVLLHNKQGQQDQ